jgi:hypothetical protein
MAEEKDWDEPQPRVVFRGNPQGFYRENRCGVYWPLLLASALIAVAGTLGVLLLVVMAIALPPMWSFVFLALWPLYRVFRWLHSFTRGWRLGIRVDEQQIQIGGLRRCERRRRAGKWPPKKGINVRAQDRAVFTCRLGSGIEGLYLITGRRELKTFARQYLAGMGSGEVPLGFLRAPMMRAGLVIVHRDFPGTSDPVAIRALTTTKGVLCGVPSNIWLIPTRNPVGLRSALRLLSHAPPVYDHVPSGNAGRARGHDPHPGQGRVLLRAQRALRPVPGAHLVGAHPQAPGSHGFRGDRAGQRGGHVTRVRGLAGSAGEDERDREAEPGSGRALLPPPPSPVRSGA